MPSATSPMNGETSATIRQMIRMPAITTADVLSCAFGFALMTAYWPGISGAATTPRWIVGALLTVVLYVLPDTRITAAHWFGIALVTWLTASLIWSEGRLDGIGAMLPLLVAASAFAVGSHLTDLRPLMVGAALGLSISSLAAVAQWYGWQGIEADGVAGLFVNRDRLAAAAALVVIGLVAHRRLWPLLPLLAPSLLLTGSRGAWLALGAGLLMLVTGRNRLWLVAAVAIGLAATLMTRDMGAWIASDRERYAIWSDTVAALNTWGHGLGSFRESFPAYAQHFDIALQGTRPEHPHSEWLWLHFEGGYPAVFLVAAFAFCVLHGNSDHARGVVVAILVLATFAMPFHDPATAILGALCAGFVAGRRARDDDAAFDRGMALRAGMAALERRGRAF